jgi:virginiamycin B lyase
MRRTVRFPVLFVLLQIAGWSNSLPASAATAPVVTEVSTTNTLSNPIGIAKGSDGALWFTESAANKIGRITTAGEITEFPIPTADSGPQGIAAAFDNALWFVESTGNRIGRITTGGIVTEFTIPTASSGVAAIAQGPDGALWFTEKMTNKIGRITTAGIVTEFPIPTGSSAPESIAMGPDQAVWFTESGANKIGRITTDGSITEYNVPSANSIPFGIVMDTHDFALFFTEFGTSRIGRIAPDGTITEITVLPTNGAGPSSIVMGLDGALWFTEGNANKIGRITTGSAFTTLGVSEYTVPTSSSIPRSIVLGPDGALWFTESFAGKIGRITVPTNRLTVVLSGTGQGQVTSSSFFPDDQPGIDCGGGVTACTFDFPPGNQISLFGTAATGSIFQGWSGGGCISNTPCTVVVDSDTTVTAAFAIAPVTLMLSVTRVGNGSGTITSSPSGISCNATCNASFDPNTMVTLTASAASGSTFTGWSGGGCVGVGICQVTLAQAKTINASFVGNTSSDITLVSALLPTSRSVQVGTAATFFGTMINASTDTAGANCTVAPTTNVPANFSFQTTDPATNATAGTPNTPVTIQPGAAQSFVLAFTPSAAFIPTDIAFSFTCTNANAAASNKGLNTLLLSASTTPVPDVIALVATASNDGIVNIPGTTGTGAFAVATANVGASGTITAAANAGAANLPVTITICQTNPTSGQCLNPPSPSAQTLVNAGTTPTFAVFIAGKGNVPFQPAANRIFVQFQDAGGSIRGSTSVAVRTQ